MTLRPLISSALALATVLALSAPAYADPKLTNKTEDSLYQDSQTRLKAALSRKPNTGKAKNVILFIGDGMGINSVSAARILAGQSQNKDAATYRFSFEAFPYAGFSRTYATNDLVTDSANGISAITTGVKTINGGIGVNGKVDGKACDQSLAAEVRTIAELAKLNGRAAGVVTNTGLTDATPAGAYGHVPNRGWRTDGDLSPEAKALGCKDLARQLVEAPEALRLDVALGGDYARFVPKNPALAKDDLRQGRRTDGLDLTQVWTRETGAKFVYTRDDLAKVDAASTRRLLGLFAPGDMPSVLDKAKYPTIPTLSDMTAKAIEILKKDKDGFFLLVESGNIDKWHHVGRAERALTDVEQLSQAVATALSMTNADETLILITADHSHSLTHSGYQPHAEPILGAAKDSKGQYERDEHGNVRPYLTYATGPGEHVHSHDLPEGLDAVLKDNNSTRPALFNMDSAKHTGEDVPVYATGPQAHLLTGAVDSTFLYQVMRHAFGFNEK